MGLLSGIGQVLAGGVAGGAKAAGESFVEQAKQEALAAREENMLRIQNLFAKEGRKETQEFQAGQTKLGHEATENLAKTRATHELDLAGKEKELKLGMAATEREFRLDLQKEENELAVRLEREKDANARARLALQHNYAVKLQELVDKKPKETMQRYNDIVEILGGDKEKARELTLYSLSGKKEEKALYAATMKGFIKNAEATGMPISKELLADWKKISQEVSGLTESDFAEKPAAPKETLVERAKRVKAEKNVGVVQPVPDANPVLDVNPVPTAKPGLLQDPAAAFEGPARDAALSQRNAAKQADYDRKANGLRAQGREKDIVRLLGPRPQ